MNKRMGCACFCHYLRRILVCSAMAVFPDVRRMMLLRRAIPMRRKRTVADRLRSVRQQRGGRFPGIKRRRRRRRLRQQHGRGFPGFLRR